MNTSITRDNSQGNPHIMSQETNTSQNKINQTSSAMESELKSLQSKIMDLENKLSFTGANDETNINEELLKSGIVLNDPF